MLRLSLAARITAIVLTALLIFWITSIGLFYWSEDLDGTGGRPSPQQVAAIAELVEQTAREKRPLVVGAVTSSILNARLEHGETPTAEDMRRPIDDTVLSDYAAALGGRPVAIVSPPVSALQRRFPRLFASATNSLEFRIGLATGETLVADSKSRLVVSRLGLPAGFGAGLLGTLVALAALIVMHRTTRPLAQIAAAVDRIHPTGEPIQLPMTRVGVPEIRALLEAFNRLQARLTHLLRARMAMLGGISHDVRTFAARLRLFADQIPDAIERERAISGISDMIRLLDDALLASRAGAGELSEELVEFDAIVRSEIEDRRAAGGTVHFRIMPDVASKAVLGDRLALRRIVANLLDNALKYGHVAHVGIETDARSVILTVDDEGAGIPIDMREIMLEPFVRLEQSRNRATGGAGLGLAVVRSLVEAHDGAVSIDDAPTGGARFVVRLPIFEAS